MDAKEHRTKLFGYLDGVLCRAEKKVKNPKTNNSDKLSYERVIVQAVNSYGKLIENADLEQRLEALEEKLKTGVLIPNGNK